MYNIFIAEGDKICREFIIHNKYNIKAIYALSSWLVPNKESLSSHHDSVNEISEREMKQISTLKTPGSVLMLLEIPNSDMNISTLSESYSIYLDRLQDPGNLGTIIRIADWFGLSHVICSPDSADFYNPKVVQASMGSMLNVYLQKMELSDVLSQVQIPIYGTFLEGKSIYQQQFDGRGILVIGNEGSGISAEIRRLVDHEISIPGHDKRVAESLNAAVATSVVCSHLFNTK